MKRSLKRIVCGMSGGVDSTVAAHLLKQKGHEVIGLFMKNWDIADETGKCMSDADREDAQLVCDHLKIPFMEVNFVKEYWHNVFSAFLADYENGYTPNPDILCNKHIKFNCFFDHAINNIGADAIATGHYAKNCLFDNLENIGSFEGVKLQLPFDRWKDQTFFISQIPQKALQRTVFPLGDLSKDIVKSLAKSIGLEKIAKKKESVGICFIGKRNFKDFIPTYIDDKPGNFIDLETGEIVGTHKGIHLYTLGQRTLISGIDKAYFVQSKDRLTQDIFVVKGTDHPALYCQWVFTEPPHWIHKPPKRLYQDQQCDLGFRYQHSEPIEESTVTLSGGNSLIVSLKHPMRAITAGQFAVLYKDDECLGSAKILRIGPSLYTLNCKEPVKNPSGVCR